MRVAVFQAMALSLWRDRAAFALTFILPPIIFAIFAAVFSSAASGNLSIRLGIVSPGDDTVSEEIISGLNTHPLIAQTTRFDAIPSMQLAVRNGKIDAAIAISRPHPTEAPEFSIYYDPVKSSAAALAEAALAAQAPTNDEDDEEGTISFQPAKRIFVGESAVAPPMAAYYAAGVGMLFIFLSGFQSALTIIEERDAGIMERIAAGPYGIRPMIDGKFAFLVAQGTAQFAIIMLVAALLFGVDLSQSPFALLVSIVFAAICAAGLSLTIVGACRSRSQAHAIGAVLALVMGALGGSMAPRFLMAPEVRAIGALTPNAWGIDALSASLWRGASMDLLLGPWLLLAVTGVVGLVCSYFIMHRTMRG